MTHPRCLVLRSAQTLSRLLRTRSTPVRACRTNTGLPWPRITCVPMSAHGQPLENHLNVFIPDRAHSGIHTLRVCITNNTACSSESSMDSDYVSTCKHKRTNRPFLSFGMRFRITAKLHGEKRQNARPYHNSG